MRHSESYGIPWAVTHTRDTGRESLARSHHRSGITEMKGRCPKRIGRNGIGDEAWIASAAPWGFISGPA
jgi:hypothetical protein